LTFLGFWTSSMLWKLEAGFHNDLGLIHRIFFGWIIDGWISKFSYFIRGLYMHRLSNDHVFYVLGMPFEWPTGWNACLWLMGCLFVTPNKLHMDDIWIFWTSSIDCACMESLMWKYNMFLEYALNGLRYGTTYSCIWGRI
jgi:hypothetical protein